MLKIFKNLFGSEDRKVVVEEKVEKVEFNPIGLDGLIVYIKDEIGVDLSVKKSIIETRIKLFCQNKNISSFQSLNEDIKYKEDLRQDLINLLTVNETYFYREEKQLQEAINFAKVKGGNINVLCAPCATGEEVYTISMLLSEELGAGAKFSVTGIDINSEAIQKAEEGLYSKRSLHKLDEKLKTKYFTPEEDMYRVDRHLFNSVKFSQANIFDDSFLNIGSFDILFSRNMLIYFDDATRVEALKRFSKLIKKDSRIFLGHADIVPKNDLLVKHGFGSNCYYSTKQ